MIPGILLYLDDLRQFDGILTDADLGAVIRALMAYVETGEEVQGLSPVCELALRNIKAKADRDIKKYEARSENGKMGGRPKNLNKANESKKKLMKANESKQKLKNQTETETENVTKTVTEERVNTDTRTQEAFNPPTLDQVRKYVTAHSLTVDPAVFWNYYKARDWMMGKAQMQDWEAALESWQTREGKPNGKPALRILSSNYSGQRDMTEDEMRGTSEDEILQAIMAAREENSRRAGNG